MRSAELPPLLVILFATACNAPPGAPSVSIEPEQPGTSDDLVASITAEAIDPNAKDTVAYTYSWTQNGTVRTDLGSDTVQSSLTTKGETWTVTVTPDDGKELGVAGSATVTIANTAPSATVEIGPERPLSTDDLVAAAGGDDPDGDAVTFAYTWTVDGVESSFAGDTVPASATSRGEVWEVTVVPNDGENTGEPVSASVSVENTAPEVTHATLGPSPAYEDSTLEVDWDGSDLDGDEISATFAFYVDGSLVQTGEEPTLTGTFFDRGQQVLALVTPSDGMAEGEPFSTDTVQILNSAPSYMSASLDPSELYEDSVVRCVPFGWNDADGDPEGAQVAWYVEGALVSTDETLDGASFDRGDDVYCTLTPDDGTDLGTPVSSAVATVGNTAPTLASATLSTTSPAASDTISVTLGATADADGDVVTVTYAWYVDGVYVTAGPSLTGSRFDRGDTIYVVVTPSDGTDDGAPVTSDTATAINSLPQLTSLTLTPSVFYTDSTAVASAVTTDADGDTVTVDYTWTVDGSVVSASGNTLSGATWFDKGETVQVTVRLHDGLEWGATGSASATVRNTLPTAPTVSITPGEPVAGEDDLLCEVVGASTDADGDAVTYTFGWLVNGAAFGGAQVDDATSSLIPATETSDAQTWQCRATPDDGEDAGSPGSASVDIGAGGEEPCTYPDSDLSVSTGPAPGPTFSPEYFSIDWIGTAIGEDVYDWQNGLSASPSYIEFEFFDASITSICSVYYDLDGALASPGWSTDSGGTLYQSWELPLVGGYTTCTAVSPTTWGTNDLRDLIELYDWGVAVGELLGMRSALRTAVLGSGGDWTNDWAPYVAAGYVWSDLFGVAYELEWLWLWEQDCGALTEVGGENVKLATPTASPLQDAVLDANGYYLFYANALIP